MHLTQRIMITADNHTETAFEYPPSSSGLRAVLAEEIRKSNAQATSPLGRVMRYWKGNPKTRVAIGMGLLAGGVIATATGALGAAGIIMWARAGISALGAFTTSKWLYDVIRGCQEKNEVEQLIVRANNVRDISELEPLIRKIESRHDSRELHGLVSESLRKENRHRIASNIIWGTAAAVAGILSLGWFSETHAAVAGVRAPILVGTPVDSSGIDIGAIANDIRTDHPGQNWITLEQMVRRVEWLRQGIPLDQSEKLKMLNASISRTVHDPHGIIATALAERGYDMNHGVDFVSRRLGDREIREIVQEYVTRTNYSSGLVAAIDTPPITHLEIPTPQFATDVIPTPQSPVADTLAPSPMTTDIPENTDNGKAIGTSLLVGSALALAGLWRKRRTVAPVAENEMAPREAAGQNPQASWETELPEVSVSHFTLSENGERVREKIHGYFRNVYGWTPDPESTVNETSKSVEVFQGSTFCGSYRVYVEFRASEVQTTILWYDHDAARMHVRSEPFAYESLLHPPTDGKSNLESRMDSLYEEMLRKREELKSEDMKGIHTVKIPKAHLEIMYRHMEQAAVRRDNNEVLGYWISSAYAIQDGTIPYVQMANPTLSEQVISRATCRPKDLHVATKYQYHLPNRMIESLFPKKEAEIILGIRHEQLNRTKRKGVVFTGAACAFNWHKHPDGITRPSWGDAQEAIRDIEIQFPWRETHPYTIAVRIKESEIPDLLGDPKVLVLQKGEYGWEYSYAIRSYNMLYVNSQYEWLPQLEIRIE